MCGSPDALVASTPPLLGPCLTPWTEAVALGVVLGTVALADGLTDAGGVDAPGVGGVVLTDGVGEGFGG